MTRRKRTDGTRIADRVFFGRYEGPKGAAFPSVRTLTPTNLAADIDRLIRKRMAEAWDEGSDEGWVASYNNLAVDVPNPYRGRKK
jgi:hypothetical protein